MSTLPALVQRRKTTVYPRLIEGHKGVIWVKTDPNEAMLYLFKGPKWGKYVRIEGYACPLSDPRRQNGVLGPKAPKQFSGNTKKHQGGKPW